MLRKVNMQRLCSPFVHRENALLFFKGNINNVHPGETAADTEKKRKTEEKNNSVVVVSVCLSLVAGIALVCVLVLRRSGSTR